MAAGGTLSIKAGDPGGWGQLSGVHFSVSILKRNHVLKETQRKPKRLYLGNQLNEERDRKGHEHVTMKFEDDNDANNDIFPKDNYADYNMFLEDEEEGSTLASGS